MPRLETEPDMEALAGTPLLDDRFLLFENLGRGGMGSVYRAFDSAEERLVAVKVPDDSLGAGPAHPLSAEFEAWSRMGHPNIIRVYELGCARQGPLRAGTPYLVLESFPGRPVHHVLQPGRVDADLIEEFARRVLHALAHVHEGGLVHGDIKPGNLLVRPSPRGPGRVKLTDFGLASEAGSAGEPGTLNGSLPFVSPESLLGAPLDGRADLYGLGIVLHLLAAGRMPVESRDPREVLRWHIEGSRADPRRAFPNLPDRLARFIVRLMERKRDERPRSAEEALLQLGDKTVRRRRTLRPAVERGDLAVLRLGLDAARLGARRLLRLPAKRRAGAAIVAEARTLAQVHGVGFYQLAAGRSRGTSNLGRIVLRVLLGADARTRALVEKHALEACLPLRLLGGIPVWDRGGAERDRGRHEPSRLRAGARRAAAFLLEASTHRAMVLVVGRGAMADPLAREVVMHLAESVRSGRAPSVGAGGFLLLLEHERPVRSLPPPTHRDLPEGAPTPDEMRESSVTPRRDPSGRPGERSADARAPGSSVGSADQFNRS